MTDIDLYNKDINLDTRRIKINDISHIDEYLYIIFNNGQKILTDGNKIYDLSNYGYVKNVIMMGSRLCAILNKGFSPCLIDLNNNEVLFDDKDAYSISKQDDRTLHVIMQIGSGENTIYDIEKKMYLPKPEGYEFENSLGNGLYVFVEADINIPFYEKKRCVINSELVTILKNIKGWIYYEDGYLIIHKDQELAIFELNGNEIKSFKTISKNDDVLTSPEYYEGKIIIVLKDKVNVYRTNLELIKSIEIEGLSKVTSSERIGDVLKLCVPTTYNNEVNGRHIFVNVKTGKIIKHLRINGYPYWSQDVFVGQDELEDYQKDIDFYFYDKDFNFITKEKGTQYYSADDENESLFIVVRDNKKLLINTNNGSIKETDYNLVRYHFSAPYGYGVHQDDETMDFFDKNLNVIIANFNFGEYDLDFNLGGFCYFIVNNYVCIITDFIDAYGRNQYRQIIVDSNGDVILDSTKHRCYPIGNFIQITKENETQFLNTLTGEIGEISFNAYVDDKGKIDFARLDNFNNQLSIDINGNPVYIKKLIHGK